MLAELQVSDLGVIGRAEISLSAGSNALTGETGAGKTLVVAAVGLLLGDRSDRVLVKEGASEARVEGRFIIPADHRAVQTLQQLDLITGWDAEVEVVISRTVPAAGASSARLNGRLVPATVLAEVAPTLVEITGQREHTRIVGSRWQREALDAFAGDEAMELSRHVAQDLSEARHAQSQIEQLRGDSKARQAELDSLRFQISEIEEAALAPGEGERLAAEVNRLDHAETLGEGIEAAIERLRGEGGVEDRLAETTARVEKLAALDSDLHKLGSRLEQLQIEVSDVVAELVQRRVMPDTAALEIARERLGAIARLKRKYGGDEAVVLSYLESARAEVAELESSEQRATEWERRRVERIDSAEETAQRLSALRRDAAKRLEKLMKEKLEELALPGTVFEVKLDPKELYDGGLESVEFLFSTSGGAPRPLSKVASGGELSRVALALHLITTSSDVRTLIFDEVDAGVGGQSAQSVGRALAQLARGSGTQVIVVTHLPQVAAFTDTHFSVTKGMADGRGSASVERLGDDDRVSELSRMLAGLPGSERARRHAEELLELAASEAVA